jgi:hypothetical protein
VVSLSPWGNNLLSPLDRKLISFKFQIPTKIWLKASTTVLNGMGKRLRNISEMVVMNTKDI